MSENNHSDGAGELGGNEDTLGGMDEQSTTLVGPIGVATAPAPRGRDRLDVRALVPSRLLPDLAEAMEAADRTSTGHEGVAGHLRTCHLAEHELLLCMLAYSLLRGSGPSVPVQALWGMDPRLGARLLAGLAAAIDPVAPGDLLTAAGAHLAELAAADEPVEDAQTAP